MPTPKKYKETYPQLLIDTLSAGDGMAEFCSEASIAACTFYDWLKKYKEFDAAYGIARMKGLAWWERKAKGNLDNPKFNGFIWSRVMRNRHPDVYTDKGRRIEVKRLKGLLAKNPKATLDERADAIMHELADGEITVEEADKAISVIRSHAEIKKVTELEQMVEDITEALKKDGRL